MNRNIDDLIAQCKREMQYCLDNPIKGECLVDIGYMDWASELYLLNEKKKKLSGTERKVS